MKVKLGEVARERRDTLRGSKRGLPVVGLEHITPSELTLTEWDVDSGNTFSKAFRKGQILFGRRRAYLKKAAVAPFDGICSGDITVIEAIPEKLLPELLPFVIQNDTFFDYAVGKSAGSLSPRVKWEHLQNFEITLPPVAEQRKLADLLWAVNTARAAYKKLLEATDELVKSQFVEMFGDPVTNEKGWEQCTVDEACRRIMGGGTPSKSNPQYYTGEIPWVTPKDMKAALIEDSIDHISEEAIKNSSVKLIPSGSVLMVIRSGILKRDLPIAINTVPVTVNQDMKAFIVGERIAPEFLMHTFNSHKADLLRNVRAVTADNIEFGIIRNMKINLPPLSIQNCFSDFAHQADKSKFELQRTIDELEATYKSLLRENLG